MDLYNRALLEKDMLAAQAGLVHASIRVLDLTISHFGQSHMI